MRRNGWISTASSLPAALVKAGLCFELLPDEMINECHADLFPSFLCFHLPHRAIPNEVIMTNTALILY